VASLVPADALLFAVPKSSGVAGRDGLALQPLSNTWRSRDERETVPRGKVLEMLNAAYAALSEAREKKRAVVGTRSDLVQMILPGTYQAGS